MRHILVDDARRRNAGKRGGSFIQVPLDEANMVVQEQAANVAALDDALQKLETIDERQGKIVELRFFGGLSIEETANVLKVSPGTVMRDWAFARAWRTGERVTAERAATFAEGVATRTTFDLTFSILREQLADVVTLTEEELMEGVRLALRATHNLAEGEELAERVAIIQYGRILIHDTLENVRRSLLGPAEFEVRLASPLNGWTPKLPDGVELREWLR